MRKQPFKAVFFLKFVIMLALTIRCPPFGGEGAAASEVKPG